MNQLSRHTTQMAIAEDIFDCYPFATLLLARADNSLPQVCHLPFLYDKEHGYFYCHVAANNPVMAMLDDGSNQAMLLFEAEHGYISPTWSEDIRVPTWDYCVVHVEGKLEEVPSEQLKDLSMSQQVAAFEDSWKMDALDERMRVQMLASIRVLRLSITDMRYRYKMSQAKTAKAKQAIAEQVGPTLLARYQSFW